MLNEIKLVAFDLDDTMVAFDLVTEQSWWEVCSAYCNRYPKTDFEKFYTTIMEVSEWWWSDPERHRSGRNEIINFRRTILKDAFLKMGIDNESDAVSVADHYSKARVDNMYLLKDIYTTLEKVRQKYRTVIITNGDSAGQRAKINRFDLPKYFDGIYVEEEMGFGKPDNRVFEKVISNHNVKHHECLILGDNPTWDIIAPGKLGWKTAFVNTRKINPDFSDYQPDLNLEHAAEITQYLL